MGIPNFYGSWLRKRSRSSQEFRGVIIRRLPLNVSSLSIDMNSMIHTALSIVLGYGDFYDVEYRRKMAELNNTILLQRVYDAITLLLIQVMNNVAPKDTVIIAIDGPTTVAKMQEQRGRRYKSSVLASIEDPDTTIVTPGTSFMIGLDMYLSRWLEDYRSYFPPNLIYSSHLVPGEGEHKIMSIYRSGKLGAKGAHVVYGLDADLIMLSLMSPLPNILLMRENETDIVDIDLLRKAIVNIAPEPLKETARNDFVALMYLLGNDFIPHGVTHHSMYEMVEAYLKSYHTLGAPLTLPTPKGGIYYINFPAIGNVIADMYKIEIKLLSREATVPRPDAFPNRFHDAASVVEEKEWGQQTVFDYSRFRSAWYNNALGMITSDPNTIHFLELLIPPVGPDMVDDMCMRFIEGMAWSFRYYQATHIDVEWYYPFSHAPLLPDLMSVMQSLPEDHGLELNKRFTRRFDLHYGALEQLLAVIPPASASLSLPSFLLPIVFDTKSPLADMYPHGIIIEMDGVTLPRFSTSRVPPFDIGRIHEVVERARDRIPEEVLSVWNPSKLRVIPMDPPDRTQYGEATNRDAFNVIQKNRISVRADRDESYQKRQERFADERRKKDTGKKVLPKGVGKRDFVKKVLPLGKDASKPQKTVGASSSRPHKGKKLRQLM